MCALTRWTKCCAGWQRSGELTPRITDLVASYGERLSSKLVAEAFAARGIPAVHVDARDIIVTDSQFGKAIPQDELIEQRCGLYLRPLDGRRPGAGDGRLYRLE